MYHITNGNSSTKKNEVYFDSSNFNVIHLIRDSLVFFVFTSFIFYNVAQAEVYLEEMFDQ